jgi:hypothetical protein
MDPYVILTFIFGYFAIGFAITTFLMKVSKEARDCVEGFEFFILMSLWPVLLLVLIVAGIVLAVDKLLMKWIRFLRGWQ